MADKSRNEESSYATDEEAVNDSSSDSEKEDNKKDEKKDSLSQQHLELDEEKPQKKKNIFKRCFYSFVPEPGTEGHRSQMGTAGWLRAGVLGANDALVSVASIMVTINNSLSNRNQKTKNINTRWVSQQIPTPPKVLFSLRALRALSPELVPWLLANLYPLALNAIWNMQILGEKNGN